MPANDGTARSMLVNAWNDGVEGALRFMVRKETGGVSNAKVIWTIVAIGGGTAAVNIFIDEQKIPHPAFWALISLLFMWGACFLFVFQKDARDSFGRREADASWRRQLHELLARGVRARSDHDRAVSKDPPDTPAFLDARDRAMAWSREVKELIGPIPGRLQRSESAKSSWAKEHMPIIDEQIVALSDLIAVA